MPPRTAHLPDSVIGLLPTSLEEFKQGHRHILAFVLGRKFQAGLPALIEGAGYFSENIQLELAVSGVARPYRHRFLISRQPGEFKFGEPAFAAKPIDNVQLGRL